MLQNFKSFLINFLPTFVENFLPAFVHDVDFFHPATFESSKNIRNQKQNPNPDPFSLQFINYLFSKYIVLMNINYFLTFYLIHNRNFRYLI